MKKPKSASNLPPVVNGSSAVRIGQPALDVAREHATRNGLTLRATIEAVLISFAEKDNARTDGQKAVSGALKSLGIPGDGNVTRKPKARRTAKGGAK